MKVLTIGDPHFKSSNALQTGILHRWLDKVSRKESPDLIVCLGDLHDSHEKMTIPVLKRCVKFLNMLRGHAETVLIIGNHDRISNRDYLTDDHPFFALKWWDNFHVIDSPKIISGKDGVNLAFVPYVPPGKFHEALKKCTGKDYYIIFAHQEFRGVDLGMGIKSKIKEEWSRKDKVIISGHIHKKQKIGSLYYVGTPYQVTFSEEGEEKGISIFDIKQTGGKFSLEEVFVKSMVPVRKTIIISSEELRKFKCDDYHPCFTRVIVKDTEAALWKIRKGLIEKLTGRGFKVVIRTIWSEISDETRSDVMPFEDFLLKHISETVPAKKKEIIIMLWKKYLKE